MTRVATNQPPSAASGSASTHSSTIAREGSDGQRAADHRDHGRERVGGADRVKTQGAQHRSAASRPQLGDHRSQRLERAAADHGGGEQRREGDDRGDERGQDEPRSAAGEEAQLAAERIAFGVARVPAGSQLRSRHPQGRELRPAGPSRASDAGARPRHRADPHEGEDRCDPFRRDETRLLAHEQHQRLPCGERQQREPEERAAPRRARTPVGGAARRSASRSHAGRGFRRCAVSPARPRRRRRPPRGRAARARCARRQGGPARRGRGPHPRRRGRGRARRSRASSRCGSGCRGHRHRARPRRRRAGPGRVRRPRVRPSRPSRVTLTPRETIVERSSQRTSLGATKATEGDSSRAPGEAAQRFALRCGVLGEQPDRVAVDAPSGDRGGLREPGARGRRDDRFGRCRGSDLGDDRVIAADDDGQGIDRARLRLDGRQRPAQMERRRCAPVGAHDEKGVDSAGHDVVSLGRASDQTRAPPRRAPRSRLSVVSWRDA